MILRDVKGTLLMLTLPAAAAAAKSSLSVAGTVCLQHLHKGTGLSLSYLCSMRRFMWKQQADFMVGRRVETQR